MHQESLFWPSGLQPLLRGVLFHLQQITYSNDPTILL